MPVWLLPWLVNRYTIGGLIGLGLLIGAYVKGYNTASAKCHDAALRAQIAVMERDMAAWKAADRVEQEWQAQIAAENADLQKQVTDYAAELAKRPEPACRLSPADVDRVRGIRNKAPAR